ncbi:DUF3427 domain-containing protein [Erysipelothrix anatis]|uniref:DUF3427 domain-containing protein n=1 Tax=Erysipelothrix anatis TaxID=2683713 RepID=UPI0014076B2C|nr:DEAD/DEAH box helicase [Erysipelothrix anatis]
MNYSSEKSNFVTNNPSNGSKVLRTIQSELLQSKEFSICVAFITESGLVVLLNQLRELSERGVKGRIITSTYQMFNHPKVFRKLMELPGVETRVYDKENLHTKGYFFKKADEETIIVGSSNLTSNALTMNREWNLMLSSEHADSTQTLWHAKEEFEDLWRNSNVLTESWVRNYEQDFREINQYNTVATSENPSIVPNKMQVNALRMIESLRQSGNKKGLVISATGTGKTYLSAFDVKSSGAKKVLFVIHREQIARDAMNTFARVMPDKKMGLLTGGNKNIDVDIVFSTIQTLSKDESLSRFERDHFDYVIFDEAHRSASKSYLKVMEYFDPSFMLGMTATPERTDDLNIFELFDHNIAYEIRLNDALEEDMLAPFHYFGVKDVEIDGKEVTEQTEIGNLVSKHRVDYLIDQIKYYGYSGEELCGLMFCSRNEEAQNLSEELNKRGFKTVALSGSDTQEIRELQIKRLTKTNELDYILTVDIFNEGIDIPEVNQIVMIRPTQSSIIFVQQLGRGLRKSFNKDYVVVIDFIGNYKNNFLIPLALSGDRSYDKNTIRKFIIEGNDTMPGSSTIEFDRISRDRIYEAINRTNFSTIRYLKKEYEALKYRINRIPSLRDYEDNNILDPTVILAANGVDNHHIFLEKVDPGYDKVLSDNENKILSFVSQEFSSGKRAVELTILKALTRNQSVKIIDIEDLYGVSTTRSALRYLSFQFNAAPEISKYGAIAIISVSGDSITRSNQLEISLESESFRKHFIELIEYGLRRNSTKFFSNEGGSMVLFEQYSRKDFSWLNNWAKNGSSTIFGYQYNKDTNTLPIFVTYNKDEDVAESINYNDHFIDQQTFNWMSKSNRTLASNDIQGLIKSKEMNTSIQLFVKRSDGEETQFYNLGAVDVIDYEQITMTAEGKNLPVVNFTLKLKNPVRDDLYYYITS